MSTTKMRIALIGCSKSKLPYVRDRSRGGRLRPDELYCGQLFRARVEYANARDIPWHVLSAALGFWRNDQELCPLFPGDEDVYDRRLHEFPPAELAAWHVEVVKKVLSELWEPWANGEAEAALPPKALTVEIHAGAKYAHPLAEILRAVGVVVELPCEGLGIGKQLSLYKRLQSNG